MKSSEIFALGYAVPMYDIKHNVRLWRCGGKGHSEADTIELPAWAVPLHELPGLKYPVAKWEDVLKAKEEYENSTRHRV